MSTTVKNLLTDETGLDLVQLQDLQQKPEPFTPGKPRFWDDPYISKQLLAAHLDPKIDAASRRPEIIERSVAWLVDILSLTSGDTVLDLGCGPGLYTTRFAQHGLQVSGVDYSQRSIDYARQYALEHQLDISYRYQDYLTLDDDGLYDAVFLIYGDFCPLSPEQRSRLLGNVHRALKPNGYFALDVTTREHRQRHGLNNRWYAKEDGFWRPGHHLVLEQGFDYPESLIYLDQYVVIETSGTVSVYRNWYQDYTKESIVSELHAGDFIVDSVWGDLAGTQYADDTEWIGVVSRKF